MRKKRIYIWMGVVSILLVVLMVIQVLWMRHANRTERRMTMLHVIKALEQVEDKLRNTNYCMITYSKLFINPGEGFYIVRQKHESSGFYGNADTVHMYTNDEMYTNTDTVLYDIPTMYSGRYPVLADMQFRLSLVVTDTTDFYREQKEFNRNTGRKRVGDIVANTRAIDSLFDMHLADSLIGRFLRSEHVEAPFGFGFISLKNNKIAYGARVTDSAGLISSPYTINIFQDNKFIRPYRLSVLFGDGRLISGMNYQIFISIFIIILLTISFYIFVRLYLDQERLSEMKSDFINNLSHEFNTPISNISLAIETLGDGANDGDKVKKILSIISVESMRLKDNVDKALQAAAMDRGEIHFHKEEVDLVAVTKTILSSYRLKCEQLGGKIDFIHPERLIIEVDETHFLNSACNLLDNAVKYRKDTPVITVTLKDEPKFATLLVADNGKGMSSETLKHIFEKFYRAHEGDVHDTKGFGLGLSYVKGIIDAHNGKISVWSRPGAGTTFTIHLPK